MLHQRRSKEAFANLARLKKGLKYPPTIFININSEQTHAALRPKRSARQIARFAVRLEDRRIRCCAWTSSVCVSLTLDDIAWIEARAGSRARPALF
jgi:hypothetical protein